MSLAQMLLELGVHVGKEDPVYLLSISVGSAALDTLMGCDLAAVMPRVIAVGVFVLFPPPSLSLSLPPFRPPSPSLAASQFCSSLSRLPF